MNELSFQQWMWKRVKRQLLSLPGLIIRGLKALCPWTLLMVLAVVTLAPACYFLGPVGVVMWATLAMPPVLYLSFSHIDWEFGDKP